MTCMGLYGRKSTLLILVTMILTWDRISLPPFSKAIGKYPGGFHTPLDLCFILDTRLSLFVIFCWKIVFFWVRKADKEGDRNNGMDFWYQMKWESLMFTRETLLDGEALLFNASKVLCVFLPWERIQGVQFENPLMTKMKFTWEMLTLMK